MKREAITRLLPGAFQQALRDASPLQALLDVMEAMHEPAEQALARWDVLLDPRRTDAVWVVFLARWVNLERIYAPEPPAEPSLEQIGDPLATGLGRLRELVAVAAHLAQWRGTADGLRWFLEIATGHSGFVIEEPVRDDEGRPRPFHFRVRMPAAAAGHRRLIERIVELEKPAHVTWELDTVG